MFYKLFSLCSSVTDSIVGECKERQDFTIQIHFISIANRHYSRDFSSSSVTGRRELYIKNGKVYYKLVSKKSKII